MPRDIYPVAFFYLMSVVPGIKDRGLPATAPDASRSAATCPPISDRSVAELARCLMSAPSSERDETPGTLDPTPAPENRSAGGSALPNPPPRFRTEPPASPPAKHAA